MIFDIVFLIYVIKKYDEDLKDNKFVRKNILPAFGRAEWKMSVLKRKKIEKHVGRMIRE